MGIDKPEGTFDRDWEWEALAAFARGTRVPRLGIVSGRRRQGKSFLLRRLCAHPEVAGLYVLAQEQTRQVALQQFVEAMARQLRIDPSIRFPGWNEALRFLLSHAPPLLVIDEFPYLLQHSPELPSVIQSLYDDARNEPNAPDLRLILCGSTLSVMTELLSGQKPLRGRALLDLNLVPFDYRESARFWGIRDLEVAFRVHAVFGGTPGYRDLVDEPPPERPDELDTWFGDHVFHPSRALLREVDYLLREDPRITDRALYQSVLTAIAGGARTPSRVGDVLGRSDRALAHPLAVLESGGFVRRVGDVLKQRGSRLALTDPIVRFHEVVVLPRMAEFEERQASRALAGAEATISSLILGPHFEHLCRVWTARFAADEGLGRPVGTVGATTLSDPRGRTSHDVDVVALEEGEPAGRRDARVALVGEAKATNRRRDLHDLERLEHVRRLLVDQGTRAAGATLALFSRTGFERRLRDAAAGRPDVLLIDLARLCGVQ
jgi:AAA+ ATPase superfamily predicted ATPase